MALLAIVFGGLLIGVGVIGYTDPSKFGEYDKISATSLIPAYFGAALVFCGLIVIMKPGARKHAMHLAALTGLLGAAGGIMPLQRSGFNFNKASAVSGMLMTGLSLLFVILCVRSFIRARQARKAAQPG